MTVLGLLTGGGDCPGLNAVIRGVVGRALERDAEVVGVLNAWSGLMSGDVRTLDRDDVRGILGRGGTILGTSRLDPYVHAEGFASITNTLRRTGIDTMIVVGGDGTLRTAARLHEEGLPVVCVPKTIDNDIPGTDVTFGFSTAVEIATEAIDRITSTAEAHNRIMLVEVMGRTKGWIATYAGIAGGADAILIPEVEYDLEQIAEIIRRRHRHGHSYSVLVVSEGVDPPPGQELPAEVDAFGFARLGGVAYRIAPVLEQLTGFETHVTVLGHTQRGGTPTAFDRVLATRMGVAAADLAADGASGVMVAARGTGVLPVPLAEASVGIRGVDQELFDVARTFFG